MTQQDHDRERVAQGPMPDQPPEDVLERLSGVPKSPEQLEAERQAVEEERLHPEHPEPPTPPQTPPGQEDKPEPKDKK
jgi:hypothetical protein